MLAGILPAPRHNYETYREHSTQEPTGGGSGPQPSKNIPAYPNRKGYLPVDVSDFADGGAYPELHIVQYPLNMGNSC